MASTYISLPIEGGGGGSGTVTSVGLTATPSSVFNVSGSPVTTSGTLALSMDNQSANTVLSGPTNGAAAAPAFRALVATDLPSNLLLASIGTTIDGGGIAITAGVKGFIVVPYACTITGWTLLADQAGSIVIDVLKTNYAGFPGSFASIAGSEKPTLSSAQNNQDLSLSTWTAAVSAGDIIEFNVEATPSIVTRVNLIINVTKT